jgi:hypothetical protein
MEAADRVEAAGIGWLQLAAVFFRIGASLQSA